MADLLRQQVLFLLRKYQIVPRKGLGQNFLVSDSITEKIYLEAAISEDDLVLEIGAGLGQLTRLLARRAYWTVALEFDPRLYALLKKEFAGFENITLIQKDATRCDYEEILKNFPEKRGKIKVIGNLPYNVAVPILVRLEKIRDQISLIIATLQKELSERLRALPGEKAYGDLTVRMQYFYEIRKIALLPAEVFYPRPKVMSEVICLSPLENPPVSIQDEQLFFRLIRAAFSQRRKILLNAMRAHPELGIPHDRWPRLFEEAEISPQRRGETLSLGEFARLCNLVSQI